MHALTLADRPDKRADWLRSGFRKMHARGNDALFAYWRGRLESDPFAVDLAEQVWATYVERHSKAIPEKGMPGMTKRMGNLAKAVVSEVAAITAGKEPVSQEVQAARLEICRQCPLLEKNVCRDCGCYMPIKSGWRSVSCGLGKWAAL